MIATLQTFSICLTHDEGRIKGGIHVQDVCCVSGTLLEAWRAILVFHLPVSRLYQRSAGGVSISHQNYVSMKTLLHFLVVSPNNYNDSASARVSLKYPVWM